ncbi:MAG: hypothetical protein K2X47_01925 [Bdellovibrionales bacterium]|nr:hypothetical protein [Bdellovibrionales bacterium]
MVQFKPTLFRLLMLFINVILVIVLFRIIPEKKIAATVAGLTFIGTSLALAMLAHRGRPVGSVLPSRSLTFWVSLGFLVLVAIPMVAVRALNWSADFSDLTIWGLPGPVFHMWSSKLFVLQPLAVVIDAGIVFINQKKKTRSTSASGSTLG